MFFSSVKRALVLAPHTDDGEFGCGGTISRLCRSGVEVHYLAFSDCRDSLPEGWPPDTLSNEVKAATQNLGIAPQNLHIFSYKVRNFTADRQAILEDLVKFQHDLNPELVLMPSQNDLHQDHQTVANEGLRAFKQTTILSYEIPWNNIEFRNQLFVKLDEEDVIAKVTALGRYKSQADRYYANEESVRAQARMRGNQIGARYAEVFEVVRAVVG